MPGSDGVHLVGLAEAAARQEFELKCAHVPWHVRTRLIEVAAALLRYLERTYGDDALARLDDAGIEAAFEYELPRAVDLADHDDFVVGAHELQDFAARRLLMRAPPDEILFRRRN